MHSPAWSGRRPRHLCNTYLVSTGRQHLPKILQFSMLCSPQKAARGFICSNLCCSLLLIGESLTAGVILGVVNCWTLRTPQATSSNDGHHTLLPFLSPSIISDTCVKLLIAPCNMSFSYEKIPTTLWNIMTQADITGNFRIKEGKKIILNVVWAAPQKNILARGLSKPATSWGHIMPEGPAGQS